MAALFNLIQEILPMVMPGSVHISRAEDIRPPSPEAEEGRPSRAVDADRKPRRKTPSAKGVNGQPTAVEDQTARADGQADAAVPSRDRVGSSSSNSDNHSNHGIPDRPRRRPGVTLRDAIVHKTDRLCASVLTVRPQCQTVVFHNAEQESIVYAVKGTAVLATLPDDAPSRTDDDDGVSDTASVPPPPTRHVLSAGDFAFVPAWTEHQVINESDTDEVEWVVVRTGSEPTVVPLVEWGGAAIV